VNNAFLLSTLGLPRRSDDRIIGSKIFKKNGSDDQAGISFFQKEIAARRYLFFFIFFLIPKITKKIVGGPICRVEVCLKQAFLPGCQHSPALHTAMI